MTGVTGIEIDKGRNPLPFAIFIDGIGILGRIQQKLFNPEFRKIGLPGKKGMQEREHVMPGSPFQKRENRQVTVRVGRHIHVEVVAEEVTFPVGVPSPVTVRLRVKTFATAMVGTIIRTVTQTFSALQCGSTDRSTITGKSQMVWINQSFPDRF